LTHKIFIASSGKNRDWALDLQESLDRITSESFEFEVWHQDIFHPSSFILPELMRKAVASSAGIFIFGPDDNIEINGEQKTITRDNVIFELGLFTGHLGINRVVIVTPEDSKDFRLMTDADGLTTVKFAFKPHSDNNRIAALGPTVNQIKRHLESVLNSEEPLNINALESVGLSNATYTTDHSSFSYAEAIKATSLQFGLLGVGADKVTANKNEFDEMVERIIHNRGRIRFLLLDPNCYYMVVNQKTPDAFENLRRNAKNSLIRIQEVINTYQCANRFEIKSYFAHNYDHMPPFRLTFVDNERCVVSPRKFSERDQSELQPQLIFRRSTTKSGIGYFGAFNDYFESIWSSSTEETVESMLAKIDKYPKRTVPAGCVHGRFQPPHTGHLNYILKAKAECETLYIGITQPENDSLTDCPADPHRAETRNNPLTLLERQEAIRRMLAEHKLFERHDYVLLPYDIDSPELLKRYIHPTWIQYTTLIDDWNVKKNQQLKKLGYVVKSLADKREDESISGTAIRTFARNGDKKYKEMVTKQVAAYLDEINFENRLGKDLTS
jgi:cytidyltransferase-like protein